ncbi:MAG: nicotinamide riboside transporter PnuC [Chitinophagales bacterium]
MLITFGQRWGWWPGIVGSAFFVWANVQQQLYFDAVLNSYYVVAGVYGWFTWSSNKETGTVIALGIQSTLKLFFTTSIVSLVLGSIMMLWTHSYWSLLDAWVTLLSFLATAMAARKMLENWLIWIIADTAAAVLYANKGGTFYGILFALYTIIAIWAYSLWKKQKISSEK